MLLVLSILLSGAMNIANIQTARTDNWTTFQNPASLDQSERFQFAAQYENQYLLADLNTATVQFAYCNPYVNVGIGYSFFGYSKYQEMMAGITLSRRFGRFTLGVGGNYMTVYAGDELKYRGTFLPELGATVNATDNFTIGVWAFNPFMQQIAVTDGEKHPVSSVYSLGTDYRFYTGFHWSVQADYDPTTTWRVATSLEWQCVEQLVVKVGAYYYQQLIGCLGFGLRLSGLQIDTHFELNPRLGLTIQARVGYRIP